MFLFSSFIFGKPIQQVFNFICLCCHPFCCFVDCASRGGLTTAPPSLTTPLYTGLWYFTFYIGNSVCATEGSELKRNYSGLNFVKAVIRYFTLVAESMNQLLLQRVLILLYVYLLSLPPRLWAVGWMVYVHTTSEPTENDKRFLSIKIMMVYYDCILSGEKLIYSATSSKSVVYWGVKRASVICMAFIFSSHKVICLAYTERLCVAFDFPRFLQAL